MVKKGSGSSKKKNISKKKGGETQKIAPSSDISEKPPETPQKKPKLIELLLKQFDTPQPEKLFSVSCDEAYYKGIEPPPFVSSTDKSEIRRIRNLLFLKFDINTFPMVMPKKKVSVRELIGMKFDAWKPKKLFSVSCGKKDVVPPPFVSSTDKAEIGRIRQLLSLKFDIGTFPMKMPKKPMTIRELLALKFDARQPEKLFVVSCGKKDVVPPPFISSTDKAEIGRIRQLLSLKFDMGAFPMKMPRKPMTIQELLALKFDVWQPEKLFVVSCGKKDVVSPPFISSTDQEEIGRIRSLLSLKFDISEFPMVMPLPPQPVIPKAEPEPGYRPPVERHEIGQATVEYTPPATTKPNEKGSEQMEKTMKYFIASLLAVFVLIIGASMSNVSDYYLVPKGQSIEVWKGIFAPLGKKSVVKMTGVQRPAEIKDVYTQDEVYPMIFNFFINKADALLEGDGMPDFGEVKNTLNTAMKYALGNDQRMAAQSRLTSIDLIVLLYKADIATGKGTVGDLKAAMGYLEKAMKLRLDARQTDLVKQRIAATQAILNNAQAAPAIKAEPVTEKASQPKEAASKDDLQSAIKKAIE